MFVPVSTPLGYIITKSSVGGWSRVGRLHLRLQKARGLAERCQVCFEVATTTAPDGARVCDSCNRLANTVRDLMQLGLSEAELLSIGPELVDESLATRWCHEHKTLRLPDGSCRQCTG